MFCGKCGKEIKEGASFCGGCGNVIPQMKKKNSDANNKSSGKEILYLALIVLSVLISNMGMFLPVIKSNFFQVKTSMNIFRLFEFNKILGVTGKSTDLNSLIYCIYVLISGIIVIATIKFFIDIIKGKRGSELMEMVYATTGLCLGRFVVAVIIVLKLNFFVSKKITSVSVWVWIITILAIVTMAVLMKQYMNSYNDRMKKH